METPSEEVGLVSPQRIEENAALEQRNHQFPAFCHVTRGLLRDRGYLLSTIAVLIVRL